jgi:thiol-disulfide isomerase/thioredoxin
MKYLSLLLFVLVLSFNTLNAKSETNSTTVDTNSTQFVLKTPNSGEIHIKEIKNGVIFEEMKDKVIALVFIAYNGKPCLKLIDFLKKMKKEHKDGFDAFAVEMRGLSGDKLNEFVKQKEINFPIIGYKNAQEFTNYIAQKARWKGTMPFIIILNKKGEVKYMQIGLVSYEGLEQAYKELK